MKAAAVLVSLTVALTSPIATSSFALAQDNTPNSGTPNHSGGTAPEGRGSTGWTGGAREPDKGGPNETTRDAGAAAGQPLTASGENLKGPPVQFPPNKTPE